MKMTRGEMQDLLEKFAASNAEYRSALLYAFIQNDHADWYGFENRPHDALLKASRETL